MDGWRLSDEQLRAWLASLFAGGRRVVAPAEEDGLVLLREVASAAEIRLDPRGRTRWSAKEFLFPATETLFSYTFDGDDVALERPPEVPEQVIFGLRPCDAAGAARLDDVLLVDELYARRRERTTLVSIACADADPACFCTAVGGSPAGTEASDLQFVPLDGAWVGCCLTERGAALVEGAAPLWPAAGEEDWAAVEEQPTFAPAAAALTLTTRATPSAARSAVLGIAAVSPNSRNKPPATTRGRRSPPATVSASCTSSPGSRSSTAALCASAAAVVSSSVLSGWTSGRL
ncbi:MAG: hypothetical protein ABSF89_13655 [Acidimicrobiales bacterium]